jgi:hypothetical protein
MRNQIIRNVATLEAAFQGLRNSDSHAGMGSITITLDDQEALCGVARHQIFNTSLRCEQLVSFCKWVVKEKKGKIKGGTEEDLVWEWANGSH